MEFSWAIVDECGTVLFWCNEIPEWKQEEILEQHPEWKIELV